MLQKKTDRRTNGITDIKWDSNKFLRLQKFDVNDIQIDKKYTHKHENI